MRGASIMVTSVSQFLRGKLDHPRIVDYLGEHGFNTDQAEELGWPAVAPDVARQKLGLHHEQTDSAEIALLMSCFNIDNTRDPSYNRAVIFKSDGTYTKTSPSSKVAANRVMFVPGMDYLNAKQIILCESLPKAAFVSLWFGIPAIGLNGVSGWSALDFVSLPPDADVVFLSDSLKPKSERDICAAAQRLAAVIPNLRHAYPLPPPNDWHKDDWGIDDAVLEAKEHGPYVFKSIVDSARPLSVKDLNTIPVTTDAEILARLSPRWIVKKIIPPGELTAIVGETSCGKTFLTMDLLLAVARGDVTHWFKQLIKRHGLVVHITLEGTSLGNRRKAYQQHHKLTESLPYVAIEVPINLRDSQTTDFIISSIRTAEISHGLPVVLVAVDTVNRALSGGDENSSVDMGALMANAERIKSSFPGSGVLLVHHLGKDTRKGARGHSSFVGNVGAILLIKEDETTKIRTITLEKQRDSDTDLTLNFKLESVPLGIDEDGEPIDSCVVVPMFGVVASATDNDNRTRYQWMYRFYIGDQNQKQPISERRLVTNLPNIRAQGHARVGGR
jgi:hypothetical protein